MLLRSYSIRTATSYDVNSVCEHCWRQLTRSTRTSRTIRRPFSKVPSSRNAAATVKSRSHVNKDYFWANGFLSDAFARSKRAIQNSSIQAGEAPSTATTASIQEQSTAHVPSSTIEQLPPHRRRKRLREQQEAAEAESEHPIPPDASSRLTTLSSNLPTRSLRRRFATYLSLAKPRLSFLIVLTTTSAYSIYPVAEFSDITAAAAPSLSTLTLLFLTSGTALCSASANALNMLFEPEHDAKMSRTRNRPLVRKLVSPRGAVTFAIICGGVGTAALYFGVNPTTAFLGALNIGLYAGVYTPMKRFSVLNTWAGAVVGGIPPLMGWAAAAGQCNADSGWQDLLFGEGSAGGWLLAALLFAWQFPHFNSLSWSIRDEYKNAGYRMLAWVNPARNGRVALRYSILMFPICIGLSYIGVTDWGFAFTSSAINGWMTWKAVQFWKEQGHKGSARGLFWASVWQLPIVMVLAMAEKKGLWERICHSLFGTSASDELDYEYEEDDEFEERESAEAVDSRRRLPP